MADEEKALIELQDRLLQGTQALSKVNQLERIAATRKVRTELMLRELSTLPEDTRMYKSVGKAYFLSDHASVVSDASGLIAACTSEVEGHKVQRAALEKRMAEAEAELRELLASNPGIIKQLAGLRAA